MRWTVTFVCMVAGLLIVSAYACASTPLTAHQEHARKLGDALQYAVPLSGLALTFVLAPENSSSYRENFDTGELLHLDGSPRHDLLLAMGRSFLLTEGLKYA